jgi:hypothetical protein
MTRNQMLARYLIAAGKTSIKFNISVTPLLSEPKSHFFNMYKGYIVRYMVEEGVDQADAEKWIELMASGAKNSPMLTANLLVPNLQFNR